MVVVALLDYDYGESLGVCCICLLKKNVTVESGLRVCLEKSPTPTAAFQSDSRGT